MDEKTKKELDYFKKDLVKNNVFYAMMLVGMLILFLPYNGSVFENENIRTIYDFSRVTVGMCCIIFGYATRIMTRVLEIQDSIEDMQEYLERLGEEDESDH